MPCHRGPAPSQADPRAVSCLAPPQTQCPGARGRPRPSPATALPMAGTSVALGSGTHDHGPGPGRGVCLPLLPRGLRDPRQRPKTDRRPGETPGATALPRATARWHVPQAAERRSRWTVETRRRSLRRSGLCCAGDGPPVAVSRALPNRIGNPAPPPRPETVTARPGNLTASGPAHSCAPDPADAGDDAMRPYGDARRGRGGGARLRVRHVGTSSPSAVRVHTSPYAPRHEPSRGLANCVQHPQQPLQSFVLAVPRLAFASSHCNDCDCISSLPFVCWNQQWRKRERARVHTAAAYLMECLSLFSVILRHEATVCM